MKLQHPETDNTFEVTEAHGNMLLEQGFYKEYVAPKRKPKTSTDKSKEV